MTESNTPPENQKKKSAFSRFFSRKKSNDKQKVEEPSQPLPNSIEPSPALDQQKPSQSDGLVNAKSPSLEKTDVIADKQSDINSPTPKTETINADNASDIAQERLSTLDIKHLNNDSVKSVASMAIPAATTKQETTEPETTDTKEANIQPTLADTDSGEPVSKEDTDKAVVNNASDESKQEATVEEGLNKSRNSFFKKISNVFKGSFNLDDELFDELEEILITSDIGIETSLSLVEKLRARVKSEKIQNAKGVIQGLRKEVAEMLQQSEQDWQFSQKPYVILMVGVNGAGKTTTTAKIAKHFQDQGKSVMLAAADTFRAAAVEQLQEWGKRLDIPVVAQAHGSDAAAVAHDALTSAKARNIDVLMIDTAGRLHTQSDLMEQLEKVNRVLAKIDPSTPHEVMQVLDSGTGQNALAQLDHFQKAVGVSSICLSKLDGSAKGGIAISLSEKYKLPIRFIGVGEGFNDIKPFNATQFANALIPEVST